MSVSPSVPGSVNSPDEVKRTPQSLCRPKLGSEDGKFVGGG